MPSSAISAQQATVRITTATGTNRTITAISKANPCVVTSTGHGYADGTIVVIDGVVGMDQVSGRVFVTTSSAANTFALRGVDSTNYGTYVSGGSAVSQTMSPIGNTKNFNVAIDEANEVDVTNLQSIAKEFRLGLKGSWTMSCDYDVDSVGTDAGQLELARAQAAGTTRAFTVTLTNGKIFSGLGYVKGINPGQGSPDGVVSGQFNIRGTNDPCVWV